MLIDIPFDEVNRLNHEVVKRIQLKPHHMLLDVDYSKFPGIQKTTHKDWFFRLETGVYICYNIEHLIRNHSVLKIIHRYDNFEDAKDVQDLMNFMGPFHAFGTADNLQQIKEQYKRFWETDRKFCLGLEPLRHHDQSEGGWRWHKNGFYIGTQDRKCEYFHDEVGIRRIISFNFCEIGEKDGQEA